MSLFRKCLKNQAIPNTTTTIFFGASVEPSIAVNPKNKNNIVAAWQQGRISNGAAYDIGIAYSFDQGVTWKLSSANLQTCPIPSDNVLSCVESTRGIAQRVGDTWLSWSNDGKQVYMANTFLNATREESTGSNQSGVIVNISKDGGATWSKPRIIASSMNYISEPTSQFANLDKDSVTADPNNPENAIIVWATFNPSSSGHGDIYGSVTYDSGSTWSSPQLIYDPFPDLVKHKQSNGIRNDNRASNNVVVILPGNDDRKSLTCTKPSGQWLTFTTRNYARPSATDEQYTQDKFPYKYSLTDVVIVRSTDCGKTWSKTSQQVFAPFVNQVLYSGGYTYDDSGNMTRDTLGLILYKLIAPHRKR